MDIILILLPFCLLFTGISVVAFFWAVKSGQFDDLTTPAIRMLFDDEPKKNDHRNKAGVPSSENDHSVNQKKSQQNGTTR